MFRAHDKAQLAGRTDPMLCYARAAQRSMPFVSTAMQGCCAEQIFTHTWLIEIFRELSFLMSSGLSHQKPVIEAAYQGVRSTHSVHNIGCQCDNRSVISG